MAPPNITIPQDQIAAFCRQHHIRKLALFGSVLRADFGPESDIDILVEFEPGTRIGFIGLAALEEELTALLGRKADLNTPGFLSDFFRDRVLREAQVQYVAA